MKNRLISKLIPFLMIVFVFFLSSCEQKHIHNYSNTWSYNESVHYHEATCGHDLVSSVESHAFDDGVITKEATITETGIKQYTCSICGYKKDEIIDKSIQNTYTVVWKNYDGSVLEIDENVAYGTMPTYNGKTPIRENSNEYSYEFIGWSPTINPVTKNIIYIATFLESTKTYEILFDLDGGTSNQTVTRKNVKKLDVNDFFFDVSKFGYTFRGWSYNGIKVFDENGNMINTVKMEPHMTFKAIFNQTNIVTITSNIKDAGEISEGGEYPFNSYIDIYAHPYQGYEFIGWYIDDILISNQEKYRYILWSEDVSIMAKFKLIDFRLELESYNSNYGLVLIKGLTNDYLPTCSTKETYMEEVFIAAYSKTDIRFLGWYDEDNKVISRNAIFTFIMPNYDYKLIAKWDYFNINYILDEQTKNNELNLNYYTTEMTNINLFSPTKDGYTFDGWYEDGVKYTTISPDSLRDFTLEAKFNVNTNTKYVVKHYKQNIDGTYPTIPTDVDNLTGTTGELTIAKLKEYIGFTKPSLYQEYIKGDESTTINLKYTRNSYTVNTLINNDKAGTITQTKSYKYEENVKIIAIINPGYTFEGWYENNELISKNLTYDLKMPAKNMTLEAKFNVNTNTKYVVKHYKQNIDGTYPTIPTDVDNLTGTTGELTIAKLKEYIGFTKPSLYQEYIKGDESTTINLKYTRNSYTVNTLINNDKAGTITQTKSYKYEENVKIIAIINPGYTFEGWYENNELISKNLTYDLKMPAKNMTVEARVIANLYTITIDAEGVNYKGEKSYTVTCGEQFNFLEVMPSKGYIFCGWEFEGETITDETGEVIDPNCLNKNMTLKPLIKKLNTYVEVSESFLYFGTYPQTLVEATNENGLLDVSFNNLTWNDYGYYNDGKAESYMFYKDIDIDNDGAFDYRGVYFTNYRPKSCNTLSSLDNSYQDDNGYFINTIYWFKYEPIKWNILKKENGKALIITDLILDSQHFYEKYDERSGAVDYQGNRTYDCVYPNNYMYSSIRKWLNETFYDIAFTELQKQIIQITKVDNSPKTTGLEPIYSTNKWCCPNTYDKLFLPSYEEFESVFSSDRQIVACVTDYAECQGMRKGKEDIYNYYMLRSPQPFEGDGTCYRNICGVSAHITAFVFFTNIGVRPVCWINLK